MPNTALQPVDEQRRQPFTPFGDCSLIRMASLYANICHVGARADSEECLRMVADRPSPPV